MQKFADNEFLSKLLEGSFEMVMNRVDAVVETNASLFGGDADTRVSVIGTFANHVIVANNDGDFFRAVFSVNEGDGDLSLGEVEVIPVPVKTASELVGEARDDAASAVDAMLRGDKATAEKHLEALHAFQQSGVRLTAEGVFDSLDAVKLIESDWYAAVRDNLDTIRPFVGAEAFQSVSKPRFDAIAEEDEDLARPVVAGALRKLREGLTDLCNGLDLARIVDESYVVRSDGADDMTTLEFMTFVRELDEDLCAVKGVVDDAHALAFDGKIETLARIHDAVASFMYEMNLAATFASKMARRFDVTSAA